MTSSYLLFMLSGRMFGVKLMGAIEILPWRAARRVPLSFSYVEGLLDYRGIIYPVHNVKQRLGMTKPVSSMSSATDQTAKTAQSIILLEENKKHFGIVVDEVLKMVPLEEQAASPEKVKGVDPKFVKGFVYDDDREIMILDFERLFHAG